MLRQAWHTVGTHQMGLWARSHTEERDREWEPQTLNSHLRLPTQSCTCPTPPQAPPEGGGVQAAVRQLIVLEVELTEVGLAAQGSSGHLGDEVVLGKEE